MDVWYYGQFPPPPPHREIPNRFWAGAVQPIYIRLLCSRITRVISEGHQWVINELSVGYQRVISGLSEGHQWVISELSVGYQLVSSGAVKPIYIVLLCSHGPLWRVEVIDVLTLVVSDMTG